MQEASVSACKSYRIYRRGGLGENLLGTGGELDIVGEPCLRVLLV